MPIPGYQGAPGFHAAGSDPYIVDRELGAFFNQRQINNPVFAGNVMIDVNDFNLQFAYEFLKLSFIEPLTASFYKAIAKFAQNDGWEKDFLAVDG